MSSHYNFDQQMQPGWTPLHVAACGGSLPLTRYLIQTCIANIKARTLHEGETPLHVATQSGHVAVVQCLLRHGADANARNKEGLTPLDIAVRNEQVEAVQLFMEERFNDANEDKTTLQVLRQEGDFFVECLHWWWGHNVPRVMDCNW